MPDFIKRWFTNWATSLLGSSAGGVLIVEGFTSIPKDWAKIVSGVLTVLLGLFAKDASVSGGPDKQ